MKIREDLHRSLAHSPKQRYKALLASDTPVGHHT